MSAAMAHARTRLPPRAPIVPDPTLLVRDDDGVFVDGVTVGTWLLLNQTATYWNLGGYPIYRIGFDVVVSSLVGTVDIVVALAPAPTAQDLNQVVTVTHTGTIDRTGHLLLAPQRAQFDGALATLIETMGHADALAPLFLTVAATVSEGGRATWCAHYRPVWQ